MRSVLPLSTEPSLSSPPHRAPPLSTRLHSTPLGLHSGRVGWHTTHCHLCCNLSQNVPFSNSAPLTAPHLTTPLDSTRVITITGINWALIPGNRSVRVFQQPTITAAAAYCRPTLVVIGLHWASFWATRVACVSVCPVHTNPLLAGLLQLIADTLESYYYS